MFWGNGKENVVIMSRFGGAFVYLFIFISSEIDNNFWKKYWSSPPPKIPSYAIEYKVLIQIRYKACHMNQSF